MTQTACSHPPASGTCPCCTVPPDDALSPQSVAQRVLSGECTSHPPSDWYRANGVLGCRGCDAGSEVRDPEPLLVRFGTLASLMGSRTAAARFFREYAALSERGEMLPR